MEYVAYYIFLNWFTLIKGEVCTKSFLLKLAMYGMFIHHGTSLTMLERKGIIKIHLVNILQTSTEINNVQISKELFIVTMLFAKYYKKVGQELRE